MPRARFIASPDFRGHHFGENHPLRVPRVPLTWDLIDAYGALTADEFLPAREASPEELAGFHERDYLEALRHAQDHGRVDDEARRRFGLGTLENPWFPQYFHLPALAAGGSVQGAEAVLRGERAFNPAGGMHHGQPGRAQGFCLINDVVLGIQRLLAEDLRVLYLDIDAHYPDGVVPAFDDDPRVALVSLHMDTDYAYPFVGGALEETGGTGQVVNAPLPRGVHDDEYRALFEPLWERLLERFRPDAVVLQAGTDIIQGDPLGKLSVSTRGFLATEARVVADAPRLLVLGGGGYHPILLARAWTGVWALLSGRDLPEDLPPAGRDLLRAVDWDDEDQDPAWVETLYRTRLEGPHGGPVRPEVVEVRRRLLNEHPLLR